MKFSRRKTQQSDIFEILPQAIATLKKNIFIPFFGYNRIREYANEKPPFRSELYTEVQLERYALTLARGHTDVTDNTTEQLLKRLAENEDILMDVHGMLTQSVKQNNRVIPAGEWLLDNFYLVEEQIYMAKKHLPKGYSKGLPQLLHGDYAGYPRVYAIAVEIISHTDGRVALGNLTGFINAYQSVTPLLIGELWAVPIMLRLALIENLRRIAIQIAIDIESKNHANYWVDEMVHTLETDPKNLVLVIADMTRANPPMDSSFIAEFTRRLQEKGTTMALPLNWIEQRVAESGFSTAEMIHLENQMQAADQLSISNSINGLRFLGSHDWREFVEEASLVEKILRQDSVYTKMDFHTRDQYRHVIEHIAKKSSLSEQAIAHKLLQLSEASSAAGGKMAHIGYYLAGKGLPVIEKLAKVRRSFGERCRKLFNKAPVAGYTGSILLFTLLLSWIPFVRIYGEGVDKWLVIVIAVLSALAVSQLAMSLVNWVSALVARPCLLPKMDFSKGVPSSCRTMVVVPTLLTGVHEIEELVEDLEVRFLANRDEHIHFALLTDFGDAKEEHQPEDDMLTELAGEKIIALNRKYGHDKNNIFFLFHRPRKWNPREKLWMGYERKRGKLEQMNALFIHNDRSPFSLIIGEDSVYPEIRYVITLDTDTQLPRDAASQMIGTMAHPLNQPVYDPGKKIVTEGYTILQPRVSNTLPHNNASLFARMHSNEQGTDPYTKAVSDVYQDIFREGSFIGKGIYDLRMFEQVLHNRFPDNRILSHDLLEGNYVRSGLLTDVQLYEEYPSQYNTDMKRRHRWIRGDWQIAAWTLPFVPSHDGKLRRNPLTALGQWKIFDNLRRSLVPGAMLLLLLYGWLISSASWFWTLMVVAIMFLPSIISLAGQLFSKPKDELLSQHILYSVRSSANHFTQQIISLICIPYEAYINTNAILHTLWRVYVSRRKLLQWNPFGSAKKNWHNTILGEYVKMWFPVLLSAALFVYLLFFDTVAFAIALPLLILWLASPYITRTISFPLTVRKSDLSVDQVAFLYTTARKIWAFFENFVGDHDNWLPPDNYQENPVERIAHRTSPTNIGLSLLSNLAAYDFGYITAGKLLSRSNRTLTSLDKMERFRGHLYNWYDTVTLEPLHPKYISTVDSGNFAGHLITLKQGVLSLRVEKVIPGRFFEGLLDTVRMAGEQVVHTGQQQLQSELEQVCRNKPVSFVATVAELSRLIAYISKMSVTAGWEKNTLSQLEEMRDECIAFLPWLNLQPLPEKYQGLLAGTELGIPTYEELETGNHRFLETLHAQLPAENDMAKRQLLGEYEKAVVASVERLRQFFADADTVQLKCDEYCNIDYGFLYDRTQHLLAIGYNVDEHRKDNSYYDLLASEARLATFLGIAQGKIPQESWFALGRQLTNAGAMPILLSWSGSMFEYLMPLLIMPSYENTLLDQTYKAVVQKQIDYGKKRNVPWGISESGYNMVDASLNYQYRAFGVPGLGFKRGLGEDLVIAPYATVMSLMVAPEEAWQNMQRMKELGFEGQYGFYEAIDYTSSRQPGRKTHTVIQSFMAHHQGMGFLSLAYLLLDQPMQRRFESDVEVKTTLLLLQERIPRVTTFYSPSAHIADAAGLISGAETPMRVISTPDTVIPEVQLLSNGNYNVMITNAGGGYSRWKQTAINRWREDSTCDNTGIFCFIRDADNDVVWSNAHQPVLGKGDSYEAVFSQGKAEFRRRDQGIETHTEIVVSPEDDIELRRVHLTNRSRKVRNIEVISYAEVVLTVPIADELHPAFNKLFIQTEILQQKNAILCSRRSRSVDEKPPFMFHLMKASGAKVQEVSYETDRVKFIGRGRNLSNAQVLGKTGPLTGTEGAVLDPVVAIRYRITIEPGESAVVDMVYGIADTKDNCYNLVNKYQDHYMISRVIELSWTHSQVILRQINALESDAQLYAKLASSIIFANDSLRADASVILKNHLSQSGLWGYSISGDLPIVLVLIEESDNIDLVKQMVQAHAYWRLKGLVVDLVIINDDHGGYRQALQNQILGFIAPGTSMDIKDQPGGIFIRSADQVSNEDRILFQTVAHIVISDSQGTLEEQVNRRSKTRLNIPLLSPTRTDEIVSNPVAIEEELHFFNGRGGFSADGKEYVIITSATETTPAPWSNVLANPTFGSIISESGQSYTWTENAHELRLTPWNNDPVCDLQGEAFYVRDEESGSFWSPAPLPCRSNLPYITRHGYGYSTFLHAENGIYSEMCVYTHLTESVKFISIRLRNDTRRTRKLSLTGYMEWVLGDLRAKSIMHVITEADTSTGALLARNRYNTALDNKVIFFDADDRNRSFTTDRAEFIGRNGLLSSPAAMKRTRLSGRTGAALDPCGVLQVPVELGEGEEREIVFRLGAGKNTDDALTLIRRFEGDEEAHKALEEIKSYWERTLNTVRVETPDRAVDLLANGWLNYQTLSSRIWARSGFYQSGGAFGFRDQLQDMLSMLHNQPEQAREQVLLCASRQFRKGDVQHWWHPPMGRGVRTTCSDDYLWLPFVTLRYIEVTGDEAVLEEQVHYLEGRSLHSGEESYYDLPIRSDESGSLYEHCVKAIEHGLAFGEHGLPLMGSGDWNDGMDRVGHHGKGESIWLAFFLYDILVRFGELAQSKSDDAVAGKCKQQAALLNSNIQQHGWDGEWYKRAFFDDGTPLGSVENEECKIDSIAQSWSVLSASGDEKRMQQAMASAYKKLVRKEEKIIQLFDPPFDQSDLNPGYIKGYVPGVRENGGQYTHAAVWLTMAFAALGDKEKTWELLQLINPVNHGSTPEKMEVYKVEPYVIAADVYAQPLHKGRGGWTWYTGSAGWMYQLILEWFIGLKRKSDKLEFRPCLPADWPSVTVHYRFGDSVYHIHYAQVGLQKQELYLDGVMQQDLFITLKNDRQEHEVKLLF